MVGEDEQEPYHYHTCRRCGDSIRCYGYIDRYGGCLGWDGDNDGCVCEGMEED